MSSLLEYAQKLASNEEVERRYAVEDIGYLNTSAGVAVLISRLAVEQSQSVLEAIFQALIRMDGEAPIASAVALLASESPLIRNEAVSVLRRKGERAVPFLEPLMHHGDKELRKLVLDVLAGTYAGGAEDLYAAALRDSDPNVVITAVENLGRLHAEKFHRDIESLLANEQDPMLTAACLEALAGLANPSSLPVIRRRFPELAALPDYLLIPCLRAIGAVGAAPDFAEMGSLLPARRPSVQSAALGAMLAIAEREGTPTTADPLLATLQEIIRTNPLPLCQYQATQLLGLWAARADVKAFLIQCSQSPEPLVRLAAEDFIQEDPPAPRG
jgi:hypothetical protein